MGGKKETYRDARFFHGALQLANALSQNKLHWKYTLCIFLSIHPDVPPTKTSTVLTSAVDGASGSGCHRVRLCSLLVGKFECVVDVEAATELVDGGLVLTQWWYVVTQWQNSRSQGPRQHCWWSSNYSHVHCRSVVVSQICWLLAMLFVALRKCSHFGTKQTVGASYSRQTCTIWLLQRAL